jgi:transcriptional regulator with XRE-family HTH domain
MTRLFPALLKHWRNRRGLSQLDLALASDVSPRHVSFLETGRAQPSREMVLRLGATLSVPLRDQNDMLRAAGFPDEFAAAPFAETPGVAQAVERMLQQHEPYPMLVLDRTYTLVRANQGAMRLFTRILAEPAALPAAPNVFEMLFDPRMVRPFVVDWSATARQLLSRLHREALIHDENGELGSLLRKLFTYPDVPESWRQPDFTVPSEPTFTLRLEREGLKLAFLTMVTVFNAPQNVTLEELRIESYFPLDDATAKACAAD